MTQTKTQSPSGTAPNLFDLSGKVAVVFGACGGIGRTVAAGLATQGATLVLADLEASAACELAVSLATAPKRAVGVGCDVCSSDSVTQVFQIATESFGRVDVVVNLAFASVLKPVVELADAEFQRTLDVCLGGAFRISRAAAQVMIPQGTGGSVIHFSSIAGFAALGRGTGAYAAAKGGLHALIRETAVEWAPHGIRVNGIAPCQTRTVPLQRLLKDPKFGGPGELEATMVSRIPLGRLAEPQDMVGACVFFASAAASMVTGQVLPVDGGFLAK